MVVKAPMRTSRAKPPSWASMAAEKRQGAQPDLFLVSYID